MEQLPPQIALIVLQQFSLNELLHLRLISQSWNRRIKEMFGPFTFFIDKDRPVPNKDGLAPLLSHFASKNWIVEKVCIRQIDLLAEDETVLDKSMRCAFANVRSLQIGECELAVRVLAFLINPLHRLTTLKLNVLLDKSIDSKCISLSPNAFNHLSELDLSNSCGMEDRCLKSLTEKMSNLQILNITQMKMVFYPNVIRRYYQPPDDTFSCWSRPTHYGFTFTIILALLQFVSTQLKQLHIGPNVGLDTVTKLMNFNTLEDIHLLFQSKLDADNFQTKILQMNNASSKRFHYNVTQSD